MTASGDRPPAAADREQGPGPWSAGIVLKWRATRHGPEDGALVAAFSFQPAVRRGVVEREVEDRDQHVQRMAAHNNGANIVLCEEFPERRRGRPVQLKHTTIGQQRPVEFRRAVDCQPRDVIEVHQQMAQPRVARAGRTYNGDAKTHTFSPQSRFGCAGVKNGKGEINKRDGGPPTAAPHASIEPGPGAEPG